MPKQRLDDLLVERGLAENRDLAQRLVMAGQVRVDGQVVANAAARIAPASRLEVDPGPPYVSRGGEKLAAALHAFPIDLTGTICADVGASTGGFTDCLLQHGAARIYAIDVGKGILHWKLRQDVRVVVMEETNARHIDRLPEPIDLVAIDASFISLRVLLPVVKLWFAPAQPGQIIALIKPQFEASRAQVDRGEGVIRDPAVHAQVLYDILTYAQSLDYQVHGLIRSPLQGPKGNLEFLTWFSAGASVVGDAPPVSDLPQAIQTCLENFTR